MDYEYFLKHYKLIAINLRKQIELENNKLILLANLKMMKQQCFSLLKNQKKQLFSFHKILWVSYKMKTQTIISLLNNSRNEESKFSTKKWYVIDSQTAKGKYKQGDTI